MKNFVIFISLLIFSSCKPILKALLSETDTEGMEGVKTKYNDDNKIFLTGRTFTYKVEQKDSNRNLIFFMDMKVIPGDYANNQTKIKYKYFYNSDCNLTMLEKEKYLRKDEEGHFIEDWELTGVIEDTTELWVHPPRSFSLKMLEFVPFPWIKYPIKLKETWDHKLHLGPGWGEYTGEVVLWEYSVDSSYIKNDTTVYVINAAANNEKIGQTEASFLYNDIDGFYKICYSFTSSGDSIMLNLVKSCY